MSKLNVITAFWETDLKLFKQSLESALQQSYKDFTLFVIDDGSKINRPDALILEYRIKGLKIIHGRLTENQGPGAARNFAFENLDRDCEYVCFLDSDDYLAPNSLQARIDALDANSKTVACYGDKYTEDIRNGKSIITLETVPDFSVNRLQRECYIPSNSVMFRKGIFDKYVGKMNENVRMCEDWLLWRKFSILGYFTKINVPIYTQVIHGKNLTNTPSVLKNHARDMMTTEIDFQEWFKKLTERVTNEQNS